MEGEHACRFGRGVIAALAGLKSGIPMQTEVCAPTKKPLPPEGARGLSERGTAGQGDASANPKDH